MTDDPLSPMDDVANMFSVDDYMYFYAGYLDAERSTNETAMAVRMLGMTQPMRVLDLACGFGRIANRLAMLGHRVTGIEYQQGFLEIARADAENNDLLRPQRRGWVEYFQGDMRTLDYTETFDRVLMMFNSFGYFSDEENLRVMRAISRALKPGGVLGFDVANRDGVLNDFHPHYVTEMDSNLLINRFSFDVITGRLRNDRIVIRDGVRKDRPFSIRLYSVTEMRSLLAEVGLVLDEVYAEWDGSPLDITAPAMVVIAHKPNQA